MYCKSCGKMIDDKLSKCPYCDAEIVNEGGNGFWDIATLDDEQAQKELKKTVIPTPPGRERETDRAILNELSIINSKLDTIPPKKTGVAPAILILLAAVCVLLCTFNMLSSSRLISTMRDAQKTADSLETPHAAAETMPEQTETPQAPEQTETPQAPVQTPDQAHAFYKQPTGVTFDEGFEGTVFTVELCPANLDGAQFGDAQWQYSETGEEFYDLGDNAAAWGLCPDPAQRNNGHYVYKLSAKELKSEATGSYRLMLLMADGSECPSDIVKLEVTG